MVMYSRNNARPVPRLPHRVFYNGRVYTDPAQWFPVIGAAMGWEEVSDRPANARWSTADGEWKEKPSHNKTRQRPPVWNGQAWTVPSKTLAEHKTDKIAAVEAKVQELIDAGFDYEIPASGNTYTYSITDRWQQNMNSIYIRMDAGGSGPDGGVWPDKDDTDRTFTDPQWSAFAEAASEYLEAILRNARLLKRDINGAPSIAVLNQANIETGVGRNGGAGESSGWPSNGS